MYDVINSCRKKKDDDDSDDEQVMIHHRDLNFDKYFLSLISFENLRLYCSVLSHYRTNGPKVNHYIHSFLHRVQHYKLHGERFGD